MLDRLFFKISVVVAALTALAWRVPLPGLVLIQNEEGDLIIAPWILILGAISWLTVFATLFLQGLQYQRRLRPDVRRFWLIRTCAYLAPVVAILIGVEAFIFQENQWPYLFVYPVVSFVALETGIGFWAYFEDRRFAKQAGDQGVQLIRPGDTSSRPVPASVSEPRPHTARFKQIWLPVTVCAVVGVLVAVHAYFGYSDNVQRIASRKISNICKDDLFMAYEESGKPQVRALEGLIPRAKADAAQKIYSHRSVKVVGFYCSLEQAVQELEGKHPALAEEAAKQLAEAKAKAAKEAAIRQTKTLAVETQEAYLDKTHIERINIDPKALPAGISYHRTVVEYSKNPATLTLPVRYEYITSQGDGIVTLACAAPTNPLLLPVDFGSHPWVRSTLAVNTKAIKRGTYYESPSRKLWDLVGPSAFGRPDQTRCVIYSNTGIITKEQGDAMMNALRADYYRGVSGDNLVLVEK